MRCKITTIIEFHFNSSTFSELMDATKIATKVAKEKKSVSTIDILFSAAIKFATIGDTDGLINTLDSKMFKTSESKLEFLRMDKCKILAVAIYFNSHELVEKLKDFGLEAADVMACSYKNTWPLLANSAPQVQLETLQVLSERWGLRAKDFTDACASKLLVRAKSRENQIERGKSDY